MDPDRWINKQLVVYKVTNFLVIYNHEIGVNDVNLYTVLLTDVIYCVFQLFQAIQRIE